jgi:hypothetical protein
MMPWKANVLAAGVAIAFFLFTLVWKPWIVLALVCFGLLYAYAWLKRYWPEAAYLIACFGHGFLHGLTGRRRRW